MRDRNKPTGTSPCINSNHDCYDCKIVAVANLAMALFPRQSRFLNTTHLHMRESKKRSA